jgi:hypothetical protein
MVVTFALAGCGGTDVVTQGGVDAFVAEVQKSVPETQAYDRGTLENIAENVCTLGNIEDAVRVLDNYSQIPAVDRDAVARIALENACAE